MLHSCSVPVPMIESKLVDSAATMKTKPVREKETILEIHLPSYLANYPKIYTIG